MSDGQPSQPAFDKFLVGTAISVFQNSGDETSNWTWWESQRNLLGQPVIYKGQSSKHSCDFWHLFRDDIARAKSLGCNSLRLSLEWARLEPTAPGQLDVAAVQTYNAILDCLEEHGMEPMLTLHHFVHPMWFERQGGWAAKGSIDTFVNFACTAFRLFGPRVRLWTTFNEPNVVAFAGYVMGMFPPGRLLRFGEAGRVLRNMLHAHAAAYDAIKAMPGGARAQVGIVHNWLFYEPTDANWNPLVGPVSRALTHMWANEVTIRFLTTGEYDWQPLGPWWGRVHDPGNGRRPGCDYVGLNYYSKVVIDWRLQPSCNRGDVMTDMPYPLWAGGMRLAIEDMSRVGVPIYITETGIADEKDDRRAEMITSYFDQVEKAVEDGYDIRGMQFWTLVDNFEWAMGYKPKFGLFAWSPDGSQTRTLREGSKAILKYYREWPDKLMKGRRAREAAKGEQEVANGVVLNGELAGAGAM